MLGFILGTMTGGVMGVFAMCLFIAGKREDEALERCRMKPKEIIDHGVCIWILFFSFSDVCQTSGYCGSLFSASSPASSAMRTRSLPSL